MTYIVLYEVYPPLRLLPFFFLLQVSEWGLINIKVKGTQPPFRYNPCPPKWENMDAPLDPKTWLSY